MIEQEKIEVMQKAIDRNGVMFNLDMAVEECAELIQAINKIKRLNMLGHVGTFESIDRPNKHSSSEYCTRYWELCSEVADVKIMIEILSKMLSKEAIDMSYERKLNRLKERINK